MGDAGAATGGARDEGAAASVCDAGGGASAAAGAAGAQFARFTGTKLVQQYKY